MTSRRTHPHGITLAELLVSMAVFALITAGFVITYRLGYNTAAQGSEKMQSMQGLRESLNRMVPLISSACPIAANQSAILSPPIGEKGDLIFTTTTEYADDYVYAGDLGSAANAFNPVDPAPNQFQQVRLRFVAANDPSAPAGRRGNVVADINTADSADDVIIARNMYDVSFTNVGENTILVQANIYRALRGAGAVRVNLGGGHITLQRYTTESRVFLPYYTNTAGGGG